MYGIVSYFPKKTGRNKENDDFIASRRMLVRAIEMEIRRRWNKILDDNEKMWIKIGFGFVYLNIDRLLEKKNSASLGIVVVEGASHDKFMSCKYFYVLLVLCCANPISNVITNDCA